MPSPTRGKAAAQGTGLPDDITARIAVLLAFERDTVVLSGSAVAKRSRDHARAALEEAIVRHLNAAGRAALAEASTRKQESNGNE